MIDKGASEETVGCIMCSTLLGLYKISHLTLHTCTDIPPQSLITINCVSIMFLEYRLYCEMILM